MGKERMKMQENMNPAPEGAQTPADEEAAREAARLSQLKADMLVLIDTVADSSRDVKLIDGDTLFERFAKRASVAEAPEVDELVREAEADIDAVLGRTDGVSANVVKFRSKSEMKAHADEVATQKAQRRVFSRREVIQNLLAGNVASVVKAAEAADDAQRGSRAALRLAVLARNKELHEVGAALGARHRRAGGFDIAFGGDIFDDIFAGNPAVVEKIREFNDLFERHD